MNNRLYFTRINWRSLLRFAGKERTRNEPHVLTLYICTYKMSKLTIFGFLLLSCQIVSSFKILGVFPHPGSSHFAVFRPLLVNLAKKGHEMTVISHFPLDTTVKNYKDISLRGSLPIWKSIFTFDKFVYFTPTEKIVKHWSSAKILTNMGYYACIAMMESQQVQDLNPGEFDLILVEDFNSDCGMGLVYKLKAPFIGLTSNVLMPWSSDNLDLISNPSYIQAHFLGYGTRPNMLQSTESLVINTFYKWYFYLFSQIPEHKLLKKYIGEDLPPLETIVRNMSILLINTYFPFNGAKPYPPNVIEVGGIYHEEVKEIPKDIKSFLDESEDGVILFSMGSMLNATSMSQDNINAFQYAFSKLKQKVLWKWEDDVMPGAPENVKIVKWIPQYDALHHKNVVGFVTHAGMLGISEAVRAGVPVLTIPMYGDQFNNAAAAEENGIGFYLDYKTITRATDARKRI
ncbi:UDP-glycosyltransferase UGT5-like isoform X2 [Arctopsyche grandis]|uniref:UDP-glycosyltransferase UGT5-like isoform X2 n=1 Tax=Arctopsyche grandis TaxID=121162 RepID=UPI00406D7209